MKLGNLLVASLLVLGVSAWAEEGGMPADQGGMPPAQQAEPTPPAEMTPPSFGSNAATPPIGKPYPQWASGMA